MSTEMNLTEWSKLTVDERKAWLHQQTPENLKALLIMLGEMLEEADTMDGELSQLIDPDESVTNARNFVHETLRDFEQHIAIAITERNLEIFERAV